MKAKIKEKIWIPIGVCWLGIFYLPYFLLGQDASFRILDFLDNEVVQYLLNGNYLFSSPDTLVEEWLSGVPLGSIQAPCFLLILFFRFLPVYTAILSSYLFDAVCAYCGMYLLCNKLLCGQNHCFSIMAALLYSILPFYPNYGLSSLGLPLVVWACLCLCEEKRNRPAAYLPYYLTMLLYGMTSSPIFTGYFVVGLMLLTAIILGIQKRRSALRLLFSSGIVIAVYCYSFRATIASVLLGTYTSHRADVGRVYQPEDFWENFLDMFKYGQYHAPSLHTYIMAFSLCIIALGILLYRHLESSTRKRLFCAGGVWVTALLIALFHAFYNSAAGLALRSHLGGLESFQLDRLYWAYPMLWYTELALCCSLLFEMCRKKTGISLQFIRIAGVFCALLITAFYTRYIIHHPCSAEYYANLQKLQGQQTSHISYRAFYDHELFEQVASYIGREQSTYRVGCIGMVPAIASVNGFYTVDGYSTNYPLSYKNIFRQVIEKELEKSELLKHYYDDWGNRCYLFSAELGTDYDIRKEEAVVIQQLELNMQKLKELGCEYLFSTVEIQNASSLKLNLLADFEGVEIRLYVYQL